MIYKDFEYIIEDLTNEEKGLVFQGIFDYHILGISKFDDPVINIIMKQLIQTFLRDEKKYIDKCKKNKENANKRWSKEKITKEEKINEDTLDSLLERERNLLDFIKTFEQTKTKRTLSNNTKKVLKENGLEYCKKVLLNTYNIEIYKKDDYKFFKGMNMFNSDNHTKYDYEPKPKMKVTNIKELEEFE